MEPSHIRKTVMTRTTMKVMFVFALHSFILRSIGHEQSFSIAFCPVLPSLADINSCLWTLSLLLANFFRRYVDNLSFASLADSTSMLHESVRGVWPSSFHFLLRIASSNEVCPGLRHSLMLLTLPDHANCTILCRHLSNKTEVLNKADPPRLVLPLADQPLLVVIKDKC